MQKTKLFILLGLILVFMGYNNAVEAAQKDIKPTKGIPKKVSIDFSFAEIDWKDALKMIAEKIEQSGMFSSEYASEIRLIDFGYGKSLDRYLAQITDLCNAQTIPEKVTILP